MEITLRGEGAEISPVGYRQIEVMIRGTSSDELLDHVTAKCAIDHFGHSDILKNIPIEDIINNLHVSDILNAIGIQDVIDHFGERELFEKMDLSAGFSQI